MSKLKFIFIGLIMVLFLSSCPREFPMDGRLKLENNSDESIIYVFTFETIEKAKKDYWNGKYLETEIIYPNSYRIIEFNIGREKQSFKENIPQKCYYLFNLDSVKTISWERLRDERIILKEVIFNSWEEMEACNFIITYP